MYRVSGCGEAENGEKNMNNLVIETCYDSVFASDWKSGGVFRSFVNNYQVRL